MVLQHRDRIKVHRDGEEVEVFNWVNIKQPAVVRGGNAVVEKFDPEIGAGDSSRTPNAVTGWVAEELRREFGIEVADHGIEVIDVESDGVDVL
jgi:hypothetical protein